MNATLQIRRDGKPIEQPKPGTPHPGPPKPGVTELGALTQHLLSAAGRAEDASARLVREAEELLAVTKFHGRTKEFRRLGRDHPPSGSSVVSRTQRA